MKIEKALEKYGLNNKEILVYTSLLQLGPSSVSKISDKSKLARSTVYEVLKALVRKGLINHYLKKKIQYFSPEEPSKLIKKLEIAKEELVSVLPQLEAMTSFVKNKPSAKFYQGKDQIKLILLEIIDEAQELYAFAVAEDFLTVLSDYHQWFLNKRIKRKIPLKLILKDSKVARDRKDKERQELREVKILPNKYDFSGIIFIWKNKTAILSLENDFNAIIIDSIELTKIQKAQFNYLWDFSN